MAAGRFGRGNPHGPEGRSPDRGLPDDPVLVGAVRRLQPLRPNLTWPPLSGSPGCPGRRRGCSLGATRGSKRRARGRSPAPPPDRRPGDARTAEPILTIDTLTDRRRGPRRASAPSELDRGPAVAGRPVLVLNNVTKTYPNGRNALAEVDLVVPEGDFVFLVGPSGAGKSTLMKLLIRDELATEDIAGHPAPGDRGGDTPAPARDQRAGGGGPRGAPGRRGRPRPPEAGRRTGGRPGHGRRAGRKLPPPWLTA